MVNYIIWNGSPALFSSGSLVIRWYGILFIAGVLLARWLLIYMYRKEGKPTADVETLTKYVFLGSVIGARFGYVLFYEPDLIWTKPFEIFLPLSFQPTFHFTGLDKLSAHGAVIGIILVLLIYCRANTPSRKFLPVFDRVSIIIALTAVFISLGSFFNSEPVGKPTESKTGVVLARPVTDGLMKVPCCIMRTPGGPNPLSEVYVKKDTSRPDSTSGHSPVLLYLFFKAGATEKMVNEFLIGDVKTYLHDRSDFVYESGAEPLHFTIFQEKPDVFTARVRTIGIARHPTPLYEAVSYALLFMFTLWYWGKAKAKTPAGSIAGLFAVIAWGFHFLYGFFKERQVPFESDMFLSVGQLLSLPFFAAGVFLLFQAFKKSGVNQS